MATSLPGEGQVGMASLVPRGPSPVPTLLQPSLEPLPPYILSEAQLRSQRYCLFSGGEAALGGSFRVWVPTMQFPQGHGQAGGPLGDSEDETGTGES